MHKKKDLYFSVQLIYNNRFIDKPNIVLKLLYDAEINKYLID